MWVRFCYVELLHLYSLRSAPLRGGAQAPDWPHLPRDLYPDSLSPAALALQLPMTTSDSLSPPGTDWKSKSDVNISWVGGNINNVLTQKDSVNLLYIDVQLNF